MNDKLEFCKFNNDQPLKDGCDREIVHLNFDHYSNCISEFIFGTTAPFAFGIHGEWGSGKTTLMRLIEEKIKKRQADDENNELPKEIIPIWFNAWQYENDEQPLIPLIFHIIEALEQTDKRFNLNGIKDSLKAVVNELKDLMGRTKLKYSNDDSLLKELLGEWTFELEGQSNTKQDGKNQSVYSWSSQDYQVIKFLNSISTKLVDKKDLHKDINLLIIIDDLDRCSPNKALILLEHIKLVLNQSCFLFLIGMEKRGLEDYLTHFYRQELGITSFEGKKYLDKIIQMPFHIPMHTDNNIRQLTHELLPFSIDLLSNKEVILNTQVSELVFHS